MGCQSVPAKSNVRWPIIVAALGQAALSFSVTSLPIALGGLVKSFGVPPTTISTAIVVYALAIAGLVMVGAKLGRRFGVVRVFRVALIMFAIGQTIMTTSQTATMMMVAQGLCGVAGAALVPSLVVLVAKFTPAPQSAAALGVLGAAGAAGAVAALLLGGILGTYVGWRPAFGLLTVLVCVTLVVSLRLDADEGLPDLRIDIVGAVLAAAAVATISLGFSFLTDWGGGLARSAAPFDILGISPAPVLVGLGVVFGRAFMGWTKRQRIAGKPSLFAAEVLEQRNQWAALCVVFSMGMLEAMLNFAVPLYIQVVQGRTPAEAAIAALPFHLSVFVSALYVARLYDKFTPRQIGRCGFGACAVALLWLAFVVKNDWSTAPVVAGLAVFGIAKGALATLALKIWVMTSPAALSGEVGALRGTTHNLSVAIGTALAGAILVALLSVAVMRGVDASNVLSNRFIMSIDLDNINFINNNHLRAALSQTSASVAEVNEAVRINTEVRLRALKVGFLIMGCLALLAAVPAGRLPERFAAR